MARVAPIFFAVRCTSQQFGHTEVLGFRLQSSSHTFCGCRIGELRRRLHPRLTHVRHLDLAVSSRKLDELELDMCGLTGRLGRIISNIPFEEAAGRVGLAAGAPPRRHRGRRPGCGFERGERVQGFSRVRRTASAAASGADGASRRAEGCNRAPARRLSNQCLFVPNELRPHRAGELPSAEQCHLKIDLFRLFGRLNKRKSKSIVALASGR